jgi:hypothetical protein
MKKQIDSLTSLAIHARDYVKRTGIQPIDKYIDFGNRVTAYCLPDYSFFSLSYNDDTKVIIHTYNTVDTGSITFKTAATVEDLQNIYDKAFKIIFDYEKNNVEILEKQKIAQIAELESKLAKLKEL